MLESALQCGFNKFNQFIVQSFCVQLINTWHKRTSHLFTLRFFILHFVSSEKILKEHDVKAFIYCFRHSTRIFQSYLNSFKFNRVSGWFINGLWGNEKTWPSKQAIACMFSLLNRMSELMCTLWFPEVSNLKNE